MLFQHRLSEVEVMMGSFVIFDMLTTSRRTRARTVIFTRTRIRISRCVIRPELLIQGEQLTTPLKHCGGRKRKHLSCHDPKLSLRRGHVAPLVTPLTPCVCVCDGAITRFKRRFGSRDSVKPVCSVVVNGTRKSFFPEAEVVPLPRYLLDC